MSFYTAGIKDPSSGLEILMRRSGLCGSRMQLAQEYLSWPLAGQREWKYNTFAAISQAATIRTFFGGWYQSYLGRQKFSL